jgi:Bacteriophage lambda head decoration protein D
MAVKTELRHDGGFLLSEADGTRSREVCTIAAGHVLQPGTVLGALSSGGEAISYVNDASDGSEAAIGILLNGIDTSITGTNAATKATYIARDAEVNGHELLWGETVDQESTDIAAGVADLAALGIILRN